MGLGVSEIAILLCWGLSILTVVGTVIYLIAQRIKKK
jgi:preprotein translocase subunit Sss1